MCHLRGSLSGCLLRRSTFGSSDDIRQLLSFGPGSHVAVFIRMRVHRLRVVSLRLVNTTLDPGRSVRIDKPDGIRWEFTEVTTTAPEQVIWRSSLAGATPEH